MIRLINQSLETAKRFTCCAHIVLCNNILTINNHINNNKNEDHLETELIIQQLFNAGIVNVASRFAKITEEQKGRENIFISVIISIGRFDLLRRIYVSVT